MTLSEQLGQIEKKHKMRPEEIAYCLDIPFSTYRNFKNRGAVRVSHWQRIALNFLLHYGPKKYNGA